MGIRILNNEDENMAVLYCSTSGIPFGSICHGWEHPHRDHSGFRFSAYEYLEGFVFFMTRIKGIDPRRLDAHDLISYDSAYQLFLSELAGRLCARCESEWHDERDSPQRWMLCQGPTDSGNCECGRCNVCDWSLSELDYECPDPEEGTSK